jgi:hypothetical protein
LKHCTTDWHGAHQIDRNEGGADTVAVGEGGKPGDVPAEYRREDLGLGFAQLGELGGHMPHGALVLAQLHCLTARHIDDAGCEALTGQSLG